MLFSIIIPVYNVENYLADCLKSVIDQSFGEWEAICINDGSTDGSAGILEEYAAKDRRIRIVEQENAGLSAARNTGLQFASGEYVLFLDSDDWLETNALEILEKNLKGEDLICFSGRRYLESDGKYVPSDQLMGQTYQSGLDYYNENALQHRDFAFVCVVLRLYRRLFLKDNNLHFKAGVFHEDNLFTPLVCFFAHKVCVINECLYDYRVRGSSITTTVNPQRKRDLLETANELAAFFVPRKGMGKTVMYRAITHHYQAVLADAANDERKELNRLCNWNLYHKVSRTKPRHIINYWINRIRAL